LPRKNIIPALKELWHSSIMPQQNNTESVCCVGCLGSFKYGSNWEIRQITVHLSR
jgi:hypothetical protein